MIVKSVAQLFAHVRADLAELDLIVLDLRMPHASGVELVRRIRKLDQGHLPILVFSGTVSSVDEVRELAALGVAGYLNEYSAVEHILPSIAPHLFPDTFNRRDSPRVVLGLAVSYRVGKQIKAALSLNLSSSGIAIRTSGPPPRDTVLKMRFALPGSKKEMETEGIVCWSRAEVGHGHPVHEREAGRSDGDRHVRRRALLPVGEDWVCAIAPRPRSRVVRKRIAAGERRSRPRAPTRRYPPAPPSTTWPRRPPPGPRTPPSVRSRSPR